MKDLIDTWLKAQEVDVESEEYEELGWAVDYLFDLAYDSPGELLEIVEKILEKSDSETVVGALGSGPIEEMLVSNGNLVIKDVETLVENNSKFSECLKYTYIDEQDSSPAVYKKIKLFKKVNGDSPGGQSPGSSPYPRNS